MPIPYTNQHFLDDLADACEHQYEGNFNKNFNGTFDRSSLLSIDAVSNIRQRDDEGESPGAGAGDADAEAEEEEDMRSVTSFTRELFTREL